MTGDPFRTDATKYWFGLPLRWALQMAHNGKGILRVLDIIHLRPMGGGLLPASHPWMTGICPTLGREIWPNNVIFRTPRPADAHLPEDRQIVHRTGEFLASRVRSSIATPGATGPYAPKMPHAINYIHGTSHYNSGWMLFDDFAEATSYFTDPDFRREVYRFVAAERREILIVFRRPEYRAKDFALFVCTMRSLFCWFCNANGPKKRVLWGNAAPYPTANLITGHWMADVIALRHPDGPMRVVRPAIDENRWFQGNYTPTRRRSTTWAEYLLAWVTYQRVRVRGPRGGMFFVDRRRVMADQIARKARRGVADEPIARWNED